MFCNTKLTKNIEIYPAGNNQTWFDVPYEVPLPTYMNGERDDRASNPRIHTS